jgi:hypothetical protein
MSRFVHFATLGLFTLCFVACGDDETAPDKKHQPTPGERLCSAIGDSLEQCPGQSTPCDQALLTDCASVVDILSGPFLDGTRACIEAGTSTATGCLVAALGALTPSAAHKELASAFCSSCAFGAPGCEDVFFSSDGSKYALGTVILPLGDAVTKEITAECTGSATCLGTFVNCAEEVLAKHALPTETAKCLVDSLVSGTSPAPTGCSGSGGSGPGSGGAGPGSGGSGPGSGGSGPGSGGSGATGCSDPGPEPNDTIGSGTTIQDSLSCFPIESSSQGGMVAGSEDVDYWSFPSATDICAGSCGVPELCPTKPTLHVDQATQATRFCLFPQCATTSSPDVVDCQAGSTPATDTGVSGCCATGSDVVMHFECTQGSSTLTEMIVRVDQPGGNACAGYAYTLTHTD